jgi:hypothetical protein
MKECTHCHKQKPEEAFPGVLRRYVTKAGVLRVYSFRRGKCKQCVSVAMGRYQHNKCLEYAF